MLRISRLRKSFGEQRVLDGIDLEVRDGEVLSLLGPSGTGKSTLLRCLIGLERADEGTLRIDEAPPFDLRRLGRASLHRLRRSFSMVFQNHNLFVNKTALENILEPMVTVQRMPRGDAGKEAMWILALVGMEDKADAYPIQLSGGEAQRIGIGRALAVHAPIMLFDEPTSSLDPERVREVLDVIRLLADERRTMLIVTHELEFARKVSTRIAFMNEGRIAAIGAPEEIWSDPNPRLRRFLESMSKKG